LVRLLAWSFPGVVWLVETGQPVAALTFDDGPDPVYTPQVLGTLARHNVRATFFVVGEHARRYPELVERIRQAGHEIGNHTDTMATTFFLSGRQFEQDLLGAEATLGLNTEDKEVKEAEEVKDAKEKRGRNNRFKLFRPAGGLIRPAQLEFARSRGYTCVLGSAYAYDPYQLPARYIRWVIRKNLRPGAIIVLHDSGGNRSNTVVAVEGLVADARAEGLRLITLSELLAAKK